MRLLLDTHVLLWVVSDPARLAAAAVQQIRDPVNELFVSAITPFEITTKHRIGKLPDAGPILAAYTDVLRTLGARELAITSRHGLIAGQLSWDHRDPFDRILAAQSIIENIPLVTSDAVFSTLGGVRTVWT
jgi:PIN domain nuclease of toxin-antitoxin system